MVTDENNHSQGHQTTTSTNDDVTSITKDPPPCALIPKLLQLLMLTLLAVSLKLSKFVSRIHRNSNTNGSTGANLPPSLIITPQSQTDLDSLESTRNTAAAELAAEATCAVLTSGFIQTLLISSKPASCYNAAGSGLNAVTGNAPPEQDMTGMAGRGGEEEATVTLL